jgi:hypothetical protein
MDLTFEEWVVKYKPEQSSLTGEPYMFETYGEDYQYVKAADRQKIWTFCDWGESECILSGWHFVNRLGYYVTEIPFDKNEDVFVSIEVYEEEHDEEQNEEEKENESNENENSEEIW